LRDRQTSFIIDDIRADYPTLLNWILNKGAVVAPRGHNTREMTDVILEMDPHAPLLTGIGRGFSTRIASLEALQLIGGVSYPTLMFEAAPFMQTVADGGILHGAYGPRTRNQLIPAVDRLLSETNTRQSVMTIWDPLHDLVGTTAKDTPCTVMLQFLIRHSKLVLHTTMRSNDAWLGIPYDLAQFSLLQLTVARSLGLEAGSYRHHAVSMHVYERDIPAMEKLTLPTGKPKVFQGLSYKKAPIHSAIDVSRRLLAGDDRWSTIAGSDEEWFTQQLKEKA
jgi:thymidylate synthase